jgi:hypothetical protein
MEVNIATNRPIQATDYTAIKALGGQKFIAMTNAKTFVADSKSITFRIGSGAKDGINTVQITLTAMDEYEVTFFKIRGTSVKPVRKFQRVCVSNLKSVFTMTTGFETEL